MHSGPKAKTNAITTANLSLSSAGVRPAHQSAASEDWSQNIIGTAKTMIGRTNGKESGGYLVQRAGALRAPSLGDSR
jgi:hypothetical protein